MKTLLPLLLVTFQATASPLETAQQLAGQVILSQAKITVSDTSPDNAAPLLGDTLTLGIAGFDPAQGVLTGVRGQLTIDAGHGLMAYRNESGGDWDSVSTLRAGWSLGGRLLNPLTVLQRVVSNRDVPVVTGTDWASLIFSTSSALDAFVGAAPLPVALTTYIGAFIDNGGGGSTAIASVLAMNGGVGGPDSDGLTAGIDWTYSWLRHAQLSFDGSAAQDALGLDLATGPAAFSLHALGDGSSTRADLTGWSCTGDCAAFSLDLAPAQGLAAGDVLGGSARFLGGVGAHQATFWLQVADDAGVGAAASRGTQTLALRVAVAAVPEPLPGWLMLAGLGVVGWYRRRR